MNHDAYEAMQARLDLVRNTLEDLDRIGGAMDLTGRLSKEQQALEDALVGEDPLVLAGLDWLRQRYADSDVVLWKDEAILMRLSGNETWVLSDVAIGDDYGALDFWRCYAIFRNTGAVYRVESGGAVADDPIHVPEGSPYDGPLEREPH